MTEAGPFSASECRPPARHDGAATPSAPKYATLRPLLTIHPISLALFHVLLLPGWCFPSVPIFIPLTHIPLPIALKNQNLKIIRILTKNRAKQSFQPPLDGNSAIKTAANQSRPPRNSARSWSAPTAVVGALEWNRPSVNNLKNFSRHAQITTICQTRNTRSLSLLLGRKHSLLSVALCMQLVLLPPSFPCPVSRQQRSQNHALVEHSCR